MRHFMLCLLILPFLHASSQSYDEMVSLARQHFKEGLFEKAAFQYSKAFVSQGDKGQLEDRFQAALAYAACNNVDSAFKQLLRLAEKTSFLDYDVLQHEGFKDLREDKRWKELARLVCGSDLQLHLCLMAMEHEDQQLRLGLDSIREKYGRRSPAEDAVWVMIRSADSLNLMKADSIFRVHGWPGHQLAGKKGSKALWLVIQHADIKTQEKYLSYLQEAANKGDADKIHLAYLEDRINIRNKRPQRYGSQFMVPNDSQLSYLYPLQDPEKVNQIRSEIGLPPLTPEEIRSAEEFRKIVAGWEE